MTMLIDITPLRASPAFARLWIGSSIGQLGSQLGVFAVGLHVFTITGLTAAVSLVALYALIPAVIAGIYGGSVIDASDRRVVALAAGAATLVSAMGLAMLAACEVTALAPYYLLAAANAAAGTVSNSARGAIIPRLLARELLPSAAAPRGVTMGLTSAIAPALAGLSIAAFGFAATYGLTALLLAVGLVGLWSLPPIRPEGERTASGFRSILEGFAFIRRSPNVRTAFLFDVLAMLLCEPRVLFPAAGALIIGGGPVTVGVLGAAGAIGSFLGALLSGWTRNVRWQGRATMVATVAYAVAILAFGLVLLAAGLRRGAIEGPDILALVAASIALALAGAADNATVIFRSAIMQAAVPDNLRGRVQGLFTVVVTSGPRMGDLFAGMLTLVVATWAPPVIGALILLALIAAASRGLQSFRSYEALNPTP